MLGGLPRLNGDGLVGQVFGLRGSCRDLVENRNAVHVGDQITLHQRLHEDLDEVKSKHPVHGSQLCNLPGLVLGLAQFASSGGKGR